MSFGHPPPPPPPPPLAPTGWLVVHVAGRMSSSSPLYEYVPKISIDGGPLMPLKSGTTTIDLSAGDHHLVVGVGSTHTDSFHYGKAPATVTVWPGQTATLHYRAPWTALSRGAIGPIPQKAPDAAVAACLVAVVAVLLAMGLLLAL